MILNHITKDNNKVMDGKSNKTIKIDRLERSMEEAMSTFKIVVEADQQNGEP